MKNTWTTCINSPGAREAARSVFALALPALLLALHWHWAAAYQHYAPWDYAMLVDGGWRVLNGQVPHADFPSAQGALCYWLVAAGWSFGPLSLGSYLHGHTLAVAVLVLAAWAGCRNRLGPASAAFLTLTVCLAGCGLNLIDHGPDILTSAMSYNRLGWALLLSLGPLLLFPHSERGYAWTWGEGILLSLGLAAAFLIKFNFALGMAGLMGCRLWVRPAGRCLGESAGVAAGATLVLLAASFLGGGFLDSYLEQIRNAGSAHTLQGRLLFVLGKLGFSWPLVAACFAASLAYLGTWLPAPFWKSALPPSGRRLLFLWMGTAACSYLVGMANMERGAVPLLPLGALAVLLGARGMGLSVPESRGLFRAAAAAALLALSSAYSLSSLASYALAWQFPAPHGAQTLLPPPSRADGAWFKPGPKLFVPADASTLDPRAYAEWVREGCALLEKHAPPASGLVVLSYMNPFDFLTNRVPQPHVPVCWHLGYLFSTSSMPDLASQKGLVCILHSKSRIEDREPEIWEHYRPWIESHFEKAGETRHWELWRRKGS